ncbi:MAG: translation elongation factor Ts [Candidatus Kapaibacterium sp.]|nr:translation elongation factor Ts [Bacteroidota bacterium]
MITPQMVKDLREKTGAGMADCKKALDETQGNMQEAIEYLRKKGAASIAKRADRSANEGLVIAKTTENGKQGSLIEANCETDFVARNEEFVAFANAIADCVLSSGLTNDDVWNCNIGDKTLGNLRDEILAKFSERIEVRRMEFFVTEGSLTPYNHAGNKLAVMLEMSVAASDDKAQGFMRDISMQIAAMNPLYVDRNFVSQEALNKEIEIYREQALNEGKKPEIADRIAQGRVEKYYQETCLVEQSFVKDGNKTVADVVKEIGADAKVVKFRRFFLGEQI